MYVRIQFVSKEQPHTHTPSHPHTTPTHPHTHTPSHHTHRHTQILGTLQAYTHWFSQLYLDTLRGDDHTHLENTLMPLMTTLVESSLPLISHEVCMCTVRAGGGGLGGFCTLSGGWWTAKAGGLVHCQGYQRQGWGACTLSGVHGTEAYSCWDVKLTSFNVFILSLTGTTFIKAKSCYTY